MSLHTNKYAVSFAIRSCRRKVILTAAWLPAAALFSSCGLFAPEAEQPRSFGIWTSAAELAEIPRSGPAWEAVLRAANQDCSRPEVSNQNDDTNVYVLAAAIVYARTGEVHYKNKVIAACERLVANGPPDSNSLAWSRETGAYALAADLAGYRKQAFKTWLRRMAELYVGDDHHAMNETFVRRPNNWGSHAFGSLCAIYRYLDDMAGLVSVRDIWLRAVAGGNSLYRYGDDVSWHPHSNRLRFINPLGAMKAGMSLDGVVPDDMRRGGSFQNPPLHTSYPWEFLQGQIMGARILERAGMPIWESGDRAIYRVAYCLQIRFENDYGGWAAAGDDEWMLPFLDEAYGTQWARQQPRLWEHGKNAGWGYVTLAPD